MHMQAPVALIILDGFGHSNHTSYNAIYHAHTPHLTFLFQHYPHTLLKASGKNVGLLDNQAGNSQAGHLTLGSGRIIPQPITILHNAINDGSFFSLPILHKQFNKLIHNKGTLHILGLLSDGGVHSEDTQIFAYIKAAVQAGIRTIVVHPFLDGRDVPPRSASIYLERLEHVLTTYGTGIIGSIQGRFYAMDRDHNWERTCLTYKVLTDPFLRTTPTNWRSVLEKSYANHITDEFVYPTRLNPSGVIKPHDGIIFCNFRPDRARQLTTLFIKPNSTASFCNHTHSPLPLTFFITPVSYQHNINTCVLFPQSLIHHSLKEILARAGKTIFSIAETEKYAHVTYFFGGYRETPFSTERRILIPSLPLKTYAQHPAMSAPHITQTVLQSLTTNPCDFYLINYANADMVGHSGDFNATIQSIECLDKQLALLYTHIVQEKKGILCITADHGKAERMYDHINHQSYTAHTANLVPFILVQKHATSQKLPLQTLADVAPFILKLMHLPVPPEMAS